MELSYYWILPILVNLELYFNLIHCVNIDGAICIFSLFIVPPSRMNANDSWNHSLHVENLICLSFPHNVDNDQTPFSYSDFALYALAKSRHSNILNNDDVRRNGI